jgi:hypothetical protein
MYSLIFILLSKILYDFSHKKNSEHIDRLLEYSTFLFFITSAFVKLHFFFDLYLHAFLLEVVFRLSSTYEPIIKSA